MVFSSITFLSYFLPLFFLLYFLADRRYKNILILVGSAIFYAWGAPQFIFVILCTTMADFYIVRMMHFTKRKFLKNALLTTSLSLNLGLLFYFKYSNFFIENLDHLLRLANLQPLR